jgi:hypothetical protein
VGSVGSSGDLNPNVPHLSPLIAAEGEPVLRPMEYGWWALGGRERRETGNDEHHHR